MNDDRRKRTRELIQLGGLVKKAGLGFEPSNVLYGILLEAAQQLNSNSGTTLKRKWMRIGKEAFEKEIENLEEAIKNEGS